MISQDPMTSLNPTRTIGSQLREAYRIHTGASVAQANARAVEVLNLVGMPRPQERLHDFPHQLSGGMRQRVMIAIGLVCEPKLLIADHRARRLDPGPDTRAARRPEATAVDGRRAHHARHGRHRRTCQPGRGHVYGGQIVEQAHTSALFREHRHRYTEALFESRPSLDLDPRVELATIPGIPPKLVGSVRCAVSPPGAGSPRTTAVRRIRP